MAAVGVILTLLIRRERRLQRIGKRRWSQRRPRWRARERRSGV